MLEKILYRYALGNTAPIARINIHSVGKNL